VCTEGVLAGLLRKPFLAAALAQLIAAYGLNVAHVVQKFLVGGTYQGALACSRRRWNRGRRGRGRRRGRVSTFLCDGGKRCGDKKQESTEHV
jgi:hypothetical protein